MERKGRECELSKEIACVSGKTQNKIIKIFCEDVTRKIMKYMSTNEIFCMLAEKASDSSSSKLLSIVVRQVTYGFSAEEFLLRCYQLDNVKSQHIVKCAKVSQINPFNTSDYFIFILKTVNIAY